MSSRFRKVYRDLSQDEKKLCSDIKESAEALETLIEILPKGMDKAKAMTRLEECVMWSTKALTG